MEEEHRRLRRRGRIGLIVTAAMITLLGLGGPIAIAVAGDPSPILAYYPVGWAVAIGGILYWLRAFRAAGKEERRK